MKMRRWIFAAAAVAAAIALTGCGGGTTARQEITYGEEGVIVFNMAMDAAVQALPDGPITFPADGDTVTPNPLGPRLGRAGNPVVTVHTTDNPVLTYANWLALSGRAQNHYSIDIWTTHLNNIDHFEDNLPHTFVVEGSTTPGTVVRLEGTDPPWPAAVGEVTAGEDGRFTIQHTLTWAQLTSTNLFGVRGIRIGVDEGIGIDINIYNILIVSGDYTHLPEVVPQPTPAPNLVLSIGDTVLTSHTFSMIAQGETNLPSITVTAENTGTAATGALNITVSNAYFVAYPVELASIAVEDYDEFTVTPAGNLEVPGEAAYHDFAATVTVANNNVSRSFTVTIRVSAEPLVGPDTVTLGIYDDPAADMTALTVQAGATLVFVYTLATDDPETEVSEGITVVWSVVGDDGEPVTGATITDGTLSVTNAVPAGTELTVKAVANVPDEDGYYAYDEVTVTVTAAAPTGVTVTPAAITVRAGGSATFSAAVAPAGANQAVTWTVGGTPATPNAEGYITVNVPDSAAVGSTIAIVATAPDAGAAGPVTGTATVTVGVALSNFISFTGDDPPNPAWLDHGIVAGPFAPVGPFTVEGGETVATWIYDAGNWSLQQTDRTQNFHGINLATGAAGLNLQDGDTVTVTGTVYLAAGGGGAMELSGAQQFFPVTTGDFAFSVTWTAGAAIPAQIRVTANRWDGPVVPAFVIESIVVYRPEVNYQVINFNLAGDDYFQDLTDGVTISGHETVVGSPRLTTNGGGSVVTIGVHNGRRFLHYGGRAASSDGLNVLGTAVGDTIRVTGRAGPNWPTADRAMEIGGAGVQYFNVTPNSMFTLTGTITAPADVRITGNSWGAGTPANMDFYIYSIIVGTDLLQGAANPADTVNVIATENFWPPATP